MIRKRSGFAILASSSAALADDDARTEVFYVDEADIDLSPRIGYQWARNTSPARRYMAPKPTTTATMFSQKPARTMSARWSSS